MAGTYALQWVKVLQIPKYGLFGRAGHYRPSARIAYSEFVASATGSR